MEQETQVTKTVERTPVIIIREVANERERDWLEDSDRFFNEDWEEELGIVAPGGSTEKHLIAEVDGELCAIRIDVPGAFGDLEERLAQHIVTACNAYGPMREALESISELTQRDPGPPYEWDYCLGAVHAFIDAAKIANAALSTLPSNDARSDEIGRLREALEQIEGGPFPGASNLAIDGNWKEVVNRLQEIARAALNGVPPTISNMEIVQPATSTASDEAGR